MVCYTRFHKSKIHFNVTKCVENVQQRERKRERMYERGGESLWVTPSQKTTGCPSPSLLWNSTKIVIYFLGPGWTSHLISLSSCPLYSHQINDWFAHSWQVTFSVMARGLRQLIGQNVPPLHPLTLVPQTVHPVAKSVSLNLTAQAHTTCHRKYTS